MVKVDEEKCIGCGACAAVCPAAFKMKGDKAIATGKKAACTKDAADSCPTNAINL